MSGAKSFFALLLWDQLHARLVGAKGELTPEQMDTEARMAVASFLQLYRPPVTEVPVAQERVQRRLDVPTNAVWFGN